MDLVLGSGKTAMAKNVKKPVKRARKRSSKLDKAPEDSEGGEDDHDEEFGSRPRPRACPKTSIVYGAKKRAPAPAFYDAMDPSLFDVDEYVKRVQELASAGLSSMFQEVITQTCFRFPDVALDGYRFPTSRSVLYWFPRVITFMQTRMRRTLKQSHLSLPMLHDALCRMMTIPKGELQLATLACAVWGLHFCDRDDWAGASCDREMFLQARFLGDGVDLDCVPQHYLQQKSGKTFRNKLILIASVLAEDYIRFVEDCLSRHDGLIPHGVDAGWERSPEHAYIGEETHEFLCDCCGVPWTERTAGTEEDGDRDGDGDGDGDGHGGGFGHCTNKRVCEGSVRTVGPAGFAGSLVCDRCGRSWGWGRGAEEDEGEGQGQGQCRALVPCMGRPRRDMSCDCCGNPWAPGEPVCDRSGCPGNPRVSRYRRYEHREIVDVVKMVVCGIDGLLDRVFEYSVACRRWHLQQAAKEEAAGERTTYMEGKVHARTMTQRVLGAELLNSTHDQLHALACPYLGGGFEHLRRKPSLFDASKVADPGTLDAPHKLGVLGSDFAWMLVAAAEMAKMDSMGCSTEAIPIDTVSCPDAAVDWVYPVHVSSHSRPKGFGVWGAVLVPNVLDVVDA